MEKYVSILDVKELTKKFGGLVAVDNLSFNLKEKEILGIIGPNGAGKTTVFNIVTGFIPPTSGRIFFKEKEITGSKPDAAASMGVGRTFQSIRPFRTMTVLENVMVAAQLHHEPRLAEVLFNTPSFLRKEDETKQRARDFLKVVSLEKWADVEAGSLTHAMQRRLEIARALAAGPEVLLLDEPAAGLNPTETAELLALIRAIRDRYGLSVIVVEHVMGLVMNLCERLIVLNYGKAIAEGSCEQIRSNPLVIEAYLGEEKAFHS